MLARIIELLVVILLIKTVLQMLLPPLRRRPPAKPTSQKSASTDGDRFNSKGHNVSDGEFEEIKNPHEHR